MQAIVCPLTEELSAYQLGKLPEEELQQVAHHAATCRACQAKLEHLEELTHNTDELLAALRRPPAAESPKTVGDGLQHTAETPLSTPAAWSLLGPPQAPDEIGRLGGYLVRQQL